MAEQTLSPPMIFPHIKNLAPSGGEKHLCLASELVDMQDIEIADLHIGRGACPLGYDSSHEGDEGLSGSRTVGIEDNGADFAAIGHSR